LSLKALAKEASKIPFIHNLPSPVRLGTAWDTKGAIMSIFKTSIQGSRAMVYILTVEASECHIFLAMKRKISGGHEWKCSFRSILGRWSSCYKRNLQQDWKLGYSVESQGECAESSGREGIVEKVGKHIEGEFKRITGLEAA
jgi:hypothetical protein